MNEREQLELENYLREFHPRMPKALPTAAHSQNWRRLAATIVLFISGSFSFWCLWHRSTVAPGVHSANESASPRESTVSLTRLALEDPSEFSSRMDRRSLKTLQHFDQPDSALRALAKD